MKAINSIKKVDLKTLVADDFKSSYSGCIVLTNENKILLQYRNYNWNRFPGYLCTFGGQIEPGEKPQDALIRELNEELGAKVEESEIINLGAISEDATNHADLIYIFFWHDKDGTITGCYEGEAKSYDSVEDVFNQPKVMDDVRFMLQECKKRRLID